MSQVAQRFETWACSGGAGLAIILAVWRSKVAERQADTARQSLLEGRYQRSAEMLGGSVLAVRLGGIYALQSLSEEDAERYHVRIMKLFCAFVRNPTEDNNSKSAPDEEEEPPHTATPLREGVQAVLQAISRRHGKQLELEGKAGFRLDLRGSNLRGARLRGCEPSCRTLAKGKGNSGRDL